MTLIAISGTDGAGKSTQIELLMRTYRERGVPACCLWGRGGYTPGFSFIKTCARRVSGRAIPKVGDLEKKEKMMDSKVLGALWLTLASLDLILFYGIYVRYKLLLGHVVILDRYIVDTELDFHLKFSSRFSNKNFLWRCLLALLPKPTTALILVVPPSISVVRSKLKNEPFPDSEEVLRFRYKKYLQLTTELSHFQLIDCTRPIPEVRADIERAIL